MTIELEGSKIQTEKNNGVEVGQQIIDVVDEFIEWIPDQTTLDFINVLNKDSQQSAAKRRSLAFSLCNNTPNIDKTIRHGRAVSAYMSFNESGFVLLEWGRIDPKTKEAKLHTYLNQQIDFTRRKEEGMVKLSSGHMAKILETEKHLVFFDCLRGVENLSRTSPIGKMINTLYSNGFIPISSDGYVQLPAFGKGGETNMEREPQIEIIDRTQENEKVMTEGQNYPVPLNFERGDDEMDRYYMERSLA